MPLWTFTDAVSSDRRLAMLAVKSFDEVVTRLVSGVVERFSAEPRNNQPCLGAHRAWFKVSVSACDYDAFFNSPVGYRAQYCSGVENGRDQNRRLIDALTPNCIAFQRCYPADSFGESLVIASLAAIDAKVWIREADIPITDDIHIDYNPWITKARAVNMSYAEEATRSAAEIGVLAPEGTIIEVKGGWTMPDGTECRDPKKFRRSEDIRDYGFT